MLVYQAFKELLWNAFDDWLVATYKDGKATHPKRQDVTRVIRMVFDDVTTNNNFIIKFMA